MKFGFDEAPANFGNGNIEHKGKLLLIDNGFDSGGMIKFSVFFKTNSNFIDLGGFHLPIKLSGHRPGDNFKGIGFKKPLCRQKISCVGYGFPVPILLHQGIEPQGYGLMPYPAGCGDGFCGMEYKKGKAGHLFSDDRGQKSDDR